MEVAKVQCGGVAPSAGLPFPGGRPVGDEAGVGECGAALLPRGRVSLLREMSLTKRIGQEGKLH